jgi:hypothetical protein
MTGRSQPRQSRSVPDEPPTDGRPGIGARLPEYRRERPRADSEARFLLRIGTPEHRVGPVVSDAEAAEQFAGLIQFARLLRATAHRSTPESG